MKSFKLFIALILLSFSLTAAANEGKWTGAFGQGNLEYFIDKGNARLYVNCPSKDSNNGGYVNTVLYVNGREVKSYKIQVNGVTYSGPFDSGTRNGENAIISFIDDLQKTDAKATYGANVVVFPKSNVSSVLHTFRSGKLGCAFN